MHDIRLLIEGVEYSGWEQVSFTRSMEALSASFSLKVSYKEPFPVSEDARIELFFDDDKLLDGYISTIEDVIEGNTASIRITGRDKTSDLIDASAVHSTQEFQNIGFEDLLNVLAKPFGISVFVDHSGIEPFKKFSLQQETAFEAIERAARLRGVFVNSDAQGNLIVQKFAQRRSAASLVMGENIESYTKVSDFTERFGEYIVRGQQQGTDEFHGDSAARPEGRAKDLKIKRYRPTIVTAEGNINTAQAQERAQWEATVKAARSVDFIVRATGWREVVDGNLWAENTLVPLKVPQRHIDQDMLIREVNFVLNDRTGHVTNIKLSRPDAFQKVPEIEEENFDV